MVLQARQLRVVEDYEKETITLSPVDNKILKIKPDPLSRITSISTVTEDQPLEESSTPSAQCSADPGSSRRRGDYSCHIT